MKKNKIFFLIVCINAFIFSGCWNYREINQTRLVAGVAIDYDEEQDEYLTTIEIITPSERKMSGEIYQSRGKLPFDSVRDSIIKTGRKLYWAHAKVVIVSQDVGKKKMIPILDYIYRDAEFREDMELIISKEKTAKEILERHTDREIYPILAYHLEDILKSEKAISKYPSTKVWKFIKDLSTEGVSPTLPSIRNISKNGKIHPVMEGAGVFKGDQFAGWLNEAEVKSYLFVIDEIKGGLLIIESKMSNKPTKITLEILKNKTKVKPMYINNELVMKVDIEADVNIGEIGGTEDFIGKKGRDILRKDAEMKIKNRIEDVIMKVQKEYDSDIFRFSKSIKKEMPSLWKSIKPNWDTVFRNLKVDVNVVVNIKGSALKSKPIKIQE